MNSKDILRYIQTVKNIALKRKKVSGSPIHIQLEPTSYCNLSCRSCTYKEKVENPRNLSFKDFKKIYDGIEPKKLTLSGVGETFMNPEVFQMIRYAKDKGTSVNTASNGTLIFKLADKIIESGLDLLKISIDSDNKETYRKVREADYFDKVVEGVKKVITVRKEKGLQKPYVRFQFVIQKANYKEIPGVVSLAHRLGVDAVNFQILELIGVEEKLDELVGDMTYENLLGELKEADILANKFGMLTNLNMIIANFPAHWKKYSSREGTPKNCQLPWFSTYVDIDGNLWPCCSFGFSFDEASMGNVFEDGIEGSWNSEKYRAFRESIKNDTVSYDLCRSCNPDTIKDMIEMSKILPGFLKKGK